MASSPERFIALAYDLPGPGARLPHRRSSAGPFWASISGWQQNLPYHPTQIATLEIGASLERGASLPYSA